MLLRRMVLQFEPLYMQTCLDTTLRHMLSCSPLLCHEAAQSKSEEQITLEKVNIGASAVHTLSVIMCVWNTPSPQCSRLLLSVMNSLSAVLRAVWISQSCK